MANDKRELADTSCERVASVLNETLAGQCGRKRNHLEQCSDEGSGECACTGGGSSPGLVDLILLIDGSGSMSTAAQQIDTAAVAAIAAAKETCPSDLRITWLTVDASKPGTTPTGFGGWSGTNFTQTHEQYLVSKGITGPFFHNLTAGGFPVNEQGADAIADLCKFFDWRKNACRAIFYASDTTLDAGLTQGPDDVAATANAIAQANANQVTVFAHFVSPFQTMNPAATQADYQNLTSATGGSLYVGAVNQQKYVELLTNAICKACGEKCVTAEFPEIAPCVSVSWGDSRCDCLETDDYEILCITICNCYSNVTFSDLVIGFVYVTDSAGNPVPTLPDGTPSVEIHPLGPICFGDIGPCRDNKPSCVSHEVVLLTRGAKGGDYQLKLGPICFRVSLEYSEKACFILPLCSDR